MQLGEAEWAIIFLSLRIALVAVLFSLPVAFAVAWVLARYEFWGKSLLQALVTMPLVLPPVFEGASPPSPPPPGGCALPGESLSSEHAAATPSPTKIKATERKPKACERRIVLSMIAQTRSPARVRQQGST